jgi:hypothetical protein
VRSPESESWWLLNCSLSLSSLNSENITDNAVSESQQNEL